MIPLDRLSRRSLALESPGRIAEPTATLQLGPSQDTRIHQTWFFSIGLYFLVELTVKKQIENYHMTKLWDNNKHRFWRFYFSSYSLVFVSIEKIYQTLETVFHGLSKHLECRPNIPLRVVSSSRCLDIVMKHCHSRLRYHLCATVGMVFRQFSLGKDVEIRQFWSRIGYN